MKTTRIFISFFLLIVVISSCNNTKQDDYLKKVLKNLEQIKSASFYTQQQAWRPGESIPSYDVCLFHHEYDNPSDSTIGASWVTFNCDDTTALDFGYNGEVKAVVYPEHKGIKIDDFTARPLPFRLAPPPFFNYAKNIIHYAVNTKDSITTEVNESENEYYFKLIIHEDKQVEFFGKAYYIENDYVYGETTSIYELWINKSNNLPYKIRKEMAHSISATTCTNLIAINHLSLDDFNLFAYFPQDYEIRKYELKNNTNSSAKLIGKKAPGWTLNDMNEQPVSLDDFKSKVLLVKFTGIGCGPCMSAIPFLKELKNSFDSNKLDIVAVEGWVRKPYSLQVYSEKHDLNYKMLSADDETLKAYETGLAAPYFFILDEQRIIKKVFFGFKEATGKEITDAIRELL